MKKILSFLAAAFLLCLTSAQIQAQTWTVAGSSTVLFGTAWSPTTASNDMVLQSGATYKWEKTNLALEAETIEFKVCQNHAWTTAYPSSNYQLQIPTAATYTVTITFNASSKAITAVATKTSDEAPQEVDHTWTVAGSSTVAFTASWDPSVEANDMVKQADGTYKWEKADLALTAETIEFKVCKDHAWGTAYPSSNYQLAIPSAGTYTIVITYNDATHAVTATATKAEGGAEPGDEPEHTYYFIGSMLGWDLTKAIPLENGQITKMIEAEDVGEYEFRLLPQNDGWDNGLGFSDINAECSSEGLKAGAEYNNIKAYFGEGEVKVQIVDGKLCITGNFEEPGDEPGDEPGEATWYIHGYINGNDYVGNDYPFAEGVATLPELTADSYIYLHKDNGTAAGVDFWTNGWTEGAETVTMTENPTPYGDKMLVPVGTQSVYMCENADGTLKVSRVALDCSEEEPGDEPQACNWDEIEFLGTTDPAYANQFKLCKEGEYPGVVNIQASFGTEIGIYVTFPSAAFGAISLPEGKYATQGAGMLLYLSAFTAQETPVSVVCQEVEYSFVVYNAAAEAPQPEEHTYTVAGNPASVFVEAWKPELADNDMVKQEDGTYKWEKENLALSLGTVEFKVCVDHTWAECYPANNYEVSIASSGNYTLTITFNPETKEVHAEAVKTGGEGGDETIENVTIYFVNSYNYEPVNAYVFNESGYKVWPGEAMTKLDEKVYGMDVYSYTFPNVFNQIIFNDVVEGQGYQTGDLTWEADKPYYYDGAWYANLDAIPEPGDEPVVSYYFIGSMMGWDLANAMPMDGDSIARMMTEEDFGVYEFKVLPQNTSWANELNFYNINTECSSENIFLAEQNNNIQVAVTTACEWKVKVVEGQLCITGIFSDPATVPVEMKQITIRAYSPGKAPKIYFWGCDSITSPEWDERPDMIADTENEGWYSYTFEKIVKAQGLNFILTNEDGQSQNLYTTGDACYDIRVVAEAEHLQDCQISGGDEPQACNWEDIEFLGSTDPAYANQFKLCKEGEYPGVVNIQASFGTEIGIYVTFPSAAFGAISLPEGKYATQGAGMLLYLSAFTAQETPVSVVCQEVEYSFVVYNAAGEAVQPDEHTYTIAGSVPEVFGEAWNPALTENDMIKLADDTYAWKKENITLPAGEIQFKVCEDHDWAVSYPAENYSLNIPESGIYVINITFDADSKEITAEATKSGEAVVMPVVQLAGDMTNWSTAPVTLTPAEDNLTASVTVELEARDYNFKIVSGGVWLTKYPYVLKRDWTTADHVNITEGVENDMVLQADVAGDYTFTWTYADSTLVITFPAAAGCNWDDIEFLGSTDPAYANQFKLCKEGEYPGVVNIQASFGTEIGIYVTFPSAAFGAISLPEGKYATQGAGMLLYLSAFTAQETPVSVVCQDVEYSFVVYNAAGDAPQPEEHTYTVAGNSPEAFGETWNPALEANDMAKQADGTYKWEKENVTLQPGEFKFKVCEDHDWAVSYPEQDYVLPIADAGVYTITIIFDAESKDIVANATKTGEAAVINYYLVGSMQGWNLDNAIPMPNDEVVLNLEASAYEFKVLPQKTSWANEVQLNAECSSEHVTVLDGGNIRIILAEAGEATVKVVEGQLCVTGDFGGEIVITTWNVVGDEALIGENWNIDSETTIMTLGEDGKYRYEIESVALAAGSYNWKIVGNHNWNVAQYPQQGDYIINIAEEANYRIVFTLDLTVEDDKLAGTAEVTKLEEPVETTYYLAGTFTNWAEGRIAFENGAVAVTLEQSEEAAAFKIIKTVGEQDTWYGNNGTMTEDNCTGWKFETSADDAHLTLSKSGLYTFNLTLNEQGEIHISVVYPSGETGIEAIMNAENAPAKFIYNGQLFIRKAGRLFNAQGQLVH